MARPRNVKSATSRADYIERFWSRVDRRADGECWEWQGGLGSGGYGRMAVGREYVATHRFAYEITNGAIPDGLFVCHSCDNPPCVNPAHLWLGTISDNHADMWAKGRGTVPGSEYKLSNVSCPSGHPFSGDNLFVNAKGWRFCRTCARDRVQALPVRKSRWVGVFWMRANQKWEAAYSVNDRKVKIGTFDNEEDAAAAYARTITERGEMKRLAHSKREVYRGAL